MTTAAVAARGEAPSRLSVRGIVKRYPGTLALGGVDLTLRAGEIHALAGQNGAGKSTLIRILAGVEPQDEGRIDFEGRTVRPGDRTLPIAFIHQDLALVDTMTVAENLALYDGYRRGPLGLVDWAGVRRKARTLLEAVGCTIDPTKTIAELSMAERSMVAIARAVARDAKVLVLDEPTAALPASDVAVLFGVLRRLQARGVAMLYVTHRMDEIFTLADHVTVLRDGMVVASRPLAEFTPASLVTAVTGRAIDQLYPEKAVETGEALVTVEKLSVEAFGPVDLTLRQGEILALVGLRGAGHEAIGRTIAGVLPPKAGRVLVRGALVPPGIAGAIAAGIGFVSGRRAEEAIAASLAVRENIYLNPAFLGAGGFGFRDAERGAALDLSRRFAIDPHDPERMAATLSGGNQQKVVLARWVAAASDVLVLEEPTAGVDVGAKTEIYQIITRLMRDGHAALLVSSDFEEVAGLAHRALVFDRGRIVRQLTGADVTVAQISLHASASDKDSPK
ncbi:sugar ABC transporter ATP-binding protein [Prosthecomicrobium pneumaticum]|uniref:Ribose transport system ATP-binding protein n=1 Tax=Prosthecomicrobium pneumaticum TaxID=81895 RepID=A0A7W9FQ56_9HYPH|nr:ribose transport system ATP-binding protein [Prosthecomicrobium pneumaticum]